VVPASISKTRKCMTFKFSPYGPEFDFFFTCGVCDCELNLVNFLNVFAFILLLNVMYSPAPKMISLLTLNFDFCVYGL